jgi:hypothetical protein
MTARREYIVRDDAIRANAIADLMARDLKRPVRVTVEPYRKRRSLAQNRLMWMYLTLVAEAVSEHTGHEPEDVHEFFKARFCPAKAHELVGEWVESKSTATLNTVEMTEYLDRIYRFSVERLGLILPTPGLFEEHRGDIAAIQEAMSQ